MRGRRIHIAVAGLVTAVSALAAGGQPPGPETSVSGQMDLARLVDLASQRLHLNIEYDAAALKAPVTLRMGTSLTDDELWTLVNRVLSSHAFTTVRVPGQSAYSVVKVSEAAGLARAVDMNAPAAAEPPPGFKSVVVRAEHRSTKDIVDALSKLVSKPAGSVTAIGDAGLLLVADLSTRIDQDLELLKLIDATGPLTVVEEVRVRNLPAPQLASTIGQVAAKRDAVSGEKTPGEVIASPNGNAVLLVAPEGRLAYWRELIASVDTRERVETATYSPKYFAAKDVAKLIEQTTKDASDERWRLVVDELTGSLVITATPSQHEAIKALILHRFPPEIRGRLPVTRNASGSE